MAGTAYAGVTDADLGYDLAADEIGQSVGVPFKQWTNGLLGGEPDVLDVPTFLTTSGTHTTNGAAGGGSPSTSTAFAGLDEADKTSFAQDWFEKIHILPRTKIDFGNIVTQVDDTYEIYSAFRETTTSLNAITNNASPGVTTPNVTPVVSVPPQTSILDPTTTDNSAGTGLGTIVITTVRALEDGLAVFDSNLVFDFGPGNDVELLVSGSRVVLMHMDYESPLQETLSFLTDIIPAVGGKEQRLSLRKNARQTFRINYKLDANDRQRMQALLFDWQDNLFALPLWHEALELTVAASASATTYDVTGADDVDLRVGGLAVIYTDANTFDVLTISALTDTLITATDPSVNAYAIGTRIAPVRTVRVGKAVSGTRHQNNLEEFTIDYLVSDNDTGALTGTTTPGFWSTYNSRVLFSGCNVINDTMNEEFSRRVYRVDNSTGIISQVSLWDRGKRSHTKGFTLRTRAEIVEFRRLLMGLSGRQKSFYIPTFIEDLTPAASLVSGASTIDITLINYERFIINREPKATFVITFDDGTSLVRIVQSSTGVTSTTERLTLDTTWPANRTISEIERIEFYELVRFDSDRIVIEHEQANRAKAFIPVKAVFDDN